MQIGAPEGSLRCTCHRGELVPIMALIGDLVRPDQMCPGIDNALNIIADMTAVLRPRHHGTGVRIRQRYLPIRCCFLPIMGKCSINQSIYTASLLPRIFAHQ